MTQVNDSRGNGGAGWNDMSIDIDIRLPTSAF